MALAGMLGESIAKAGLGAGLNSGETGLGGAKFDYRQTRYLVVWQSDWRRADSVKRMSESQPALFRGRHFRSESIVLCVRWYLRYPLSYRDLEEMMAKRGLTVDHSSIARWVLYYAPILNRRIRARDALSQSNLEGR